jgi:hypothetical protein
MPHYRIYSVDPKGHIWTPPDLVVCPDDQVAIQKAEQAVKGETVELWEGARFVTCIPSKKQ